MTDKIHHCGFVVFDMRAAETPDDAAIEKHVQDLLQFTLNEGKKNNLSYADVMCAAIEFAARLCAAGTSFHEPDTEKDDRLVAELTNNFRNRMRSAMEGQAPGEDSDSAHPH